MKKRMSSVSSAKMHPARISLRFVFTLLCYVFCFGNGKKWKTYLMFGSEVFRNEHHLTLESTSPPYDQSKLFILTAL